MIGGNHQAELSDGSVPRMFQFLPYKLHPGAVKSGTIVFREVHPITLAALRNAKNP
jgi:hypothetical protein